MAIALLCKPSKSLGSYQQFEHFRTKNASSSRRNNKNIETFEYGVTENDKIDISNKFRIILRLAYVHSCHEYIFFLNFSALHSFLWYKFSESDLVWETWLNYWQQDHAAELYCTIKYVWTGEDLTLRYNWIFIEIIKRTATETTIWIYGIFVWPRRRLLRNRNRMIIN